MDMKKIGSRINNLDLLPAELRKQLKILKVDDTEEKIVKVLKERFEGIATVDEILVGLYQDTGEVFSRSYLVNKLGRMMRYEFALIEGIDGRRGVYKLKELKLDKIEDQSDFSQEEISD